MLPNGSNVDIMHKMKTKVSQRQQCQNNSKIQSEYRRSTEKIPKMSSGLEWSLQRKRGEIKQFFLDQAFPLIEMIRSCMHVFST